MKQETKKYFSSKNEIVVDYILNDAVEDSVLICINDDITRKYIVQTWYDSSTPYAFNNMDKDIIFDNKSDARRERAKRSRAWEFKFKSLFIQE